MAHILEQVGEKSRQGIDRIAHRCHSFKAKLDDIGYYYLAQQAIEGSLFPEETKKYVYFSALTWGINSKDPAFSRVILYCVSATYLCEKVVLPILAFRRKLQNFMGTDVEY